jgi:translation initiation factor IF-3
VPKVRVISETGEQLGVLSTYDALERARNLGLDLVEVAPTAKPPVCKILDHGKFKYQQQKKVQQAKKKQHVTEMKEVRMRPKTDTHDIQIKLSKAREFLDDGYKVQFTMLFRGREQLHRDLGRETFRDIATQLDDISKIERETRVEGRRMILILGPKAIVEKEKKPKPAKEARVPSEVKVETSEPETTQPSEITPETDNGNV